MELMEKVMIMLEQEPEKEFMVMDSEMNPLCYAWFSNHPILLHVSPINGIECPEKADVLYDLLKGRYVIEKITLIPDEDEQYYSVYGEGQVLPQYFSTKAHNYFDVFMDNVHATEEAAKQSREEHKKLEWGFIDWVISGARFKDILRNIERERERPHE